MQSESSLFAELMDALRILPGVGPRSAQRMAYYLLHRDPAGAKRLSQALSMAVDNIRHCARCNTYTEDQLCSICQNPKRDTSQLCIVETPADLMMIEQTQSYSGLYFVLMGHLSPLDGIGPKDIHLDRLLARMEDTGLSEVILATNFTNEGESTAYYIAEMLKNNPHISVTRIARGLPAGSEVEYVDIGTLAQALVERRQLGY